MEPMRNGFIQSKLNSPDRPKMRLGLNSGLKDPITTRLPLFVAAIAAAAEAMEILPIDIRTGTDLDSSHGRWIVATLLRDTTELTWKEIGFGLRMNDATLATRYRVFKSWAHDRKFSGMISTAERLFSELLRSAPVIADSGLVGDAEDDPTHPDVLASDDSSTANRAEVQPAKLGGRDELYKLLRGDAYRNNVCAVAEKLRGLQAAYGGIVLREAVQVVVGARA